MTEDNTKMTTAVVKQIAEKMAIANQMVGDVKNLLASNNFQTWMDAPMAVKLDIEDIVELARICKKKPEARPFWGDYEVSFSIYGCVFSTSWIKENQLKYWLDNGYVKMRGEKNNGTT